MIINPSAHPVIPRMHSMQHHSLSRRGLSVDFAGGKPLWSALAKLLSVVVLLVFFSSLWLGNSVTQVNAEIEGLEVERQELVHANIVLRAQKARLFSPEAVGSLAGDQLAIHLPASGQYRKF